MNIYDIKRAFCLYEKGKKAVVWLESNIVTAVKNIFVYTQSGEGSKGKRVYIVSYF